MEATLERSNRAQRISYYVSTLKRSQPAMLENGLKTMYLRAMAQKLDSSAPEHEMTMQEIVDEVNTVRKERHEKQNRI
ncbi:MAG: hypothetical protein LBL94_04640 [Prevotellaceae bacterium]|jgi:hypothetical protein|nr:hypothetical protein [Prevotellaceae bacterium]